jgi:hypothetical protein
VSRYETLGKAKTFLASLNATRGQSDQLIFFSYRSRHLGTPDNNKSYRRLLIVVPGAADQGIPEKWVQFGVTDPGKKVPIRNVSIVSALLNSDGTFNAYFKDYFRTYRQRFKKQLWPTTRFAGVEREPQDGVHFCGEHTSIDAQGYLEGAVETGERAADEVISALR